MSGRLRDARGVLHPLGSPCSAGKDGALVPLAGKRASKNHAELTWAGGTWTVTDRSTNGTLVNGRRVMPGSATPLREGDRLTFVGHEGGDWVLDTNEPPVALAHCLDDGAHVLARHGQLILPAEDDPEIVVFRDDEGRWWLEGDGPPRAAERRPISCRGAVWALYLPQDDATEVAPEGLTLAEITLHLRPNRAWDHAAAWMETPTRRADLGEGRHWLVAAILARDRLGDHGPDDDRGWVDNLVTADDAGIKEKSVATFISRIRDDLRAAGVMDAPLVIEARPNRRRIFPNVVLHDGE